MSAATGVIRVVGPQRTRVLRRRIRVVVGVTIGANAVEALVAISTGAGAGSAALVAFGLDSVVEVLSAAAVAWQFAAPDPERRERVALRLIALSFFGLAAYVVIDVGLAVVGLSEPAPSPLGVGLAIASVVVMPVLSLAERRTGRELGSASAVADGRQSLICAALSAALLVGLVLNAAFGWAWADSVAALVVVVFAVREGLEAWRGDACAVPMAVLTGEAEAGADGCADGCR